MHPSSSLSALLTALLSLAACATAVTTPSGDGGNGGEGAGDGSGGGTVSCEPGESEACYSGPPGTEGVGLCKAGLRTCTKSGVLGPCEGQVGPATEECNGVDDDCNGTVDDGCECTAGETEPCYTGPSGTEGVGICKGGVQTCGAGQWGACDGQVLPAAEACNNSVDDNCNGAVDESCCGNGTCEAGETCTSCPGDCGPCNNPNLCIPGDCGGFNWTGNCACDSFCSSFGDCCANACTFCQVC